MPPSPPAPKPKLVFHRHYLTQARLQRTISNTIVDLERYRKERLRRADDPKEPGESKFRGGLIWDDGEQPYYSFPPSIRGLDGVWRDIPRALAGDFSNFDEPQPAGPSPKPNGAG